MTTEPELILIRGGFRSGVAGHATIADKQLICGETESLAEFTSRVMAAATEAGEAFAIIGGLPCDGGTDAGTDCHG